MWEFVGLHLSHGLTFVSQTSSLDTEITCLRLIAVAIWMITWIITMSDVTSRNPRNISRTVSNEIYKCLAVENLCPEAEIIFQRRIILGIKIFKRHGESRYGIRKWTTCSVTRRATRSYKKVSENMLCQLLSPRHHNWSKYLPYGNNTLKETIGEI